MGTHGISWNGEKNKSGECNNRLSNGPATQSIQFSCKSDTSAEGRITSTIVPFPILLSKVTVPWWFLMICRADHNSEACPFLFVRIKGMPRRDNFSGEIPVPSSFIMIETPHPPP